MYSHPGGENMQVWHIFMRQSSKLRKSSIDLKWRMNEPPACVRLSRHDNPFSLPSKISVVQNNSWFILWRWMIHPQFINDLNTIYFPPQSISEVFSSQTIKLSQELESECQAIVQIWLIKLNSKWWSNIFQKQNYGLCLMFNQVKYSSQTTILSDKSSYTRHFQKDLSNSTSLD